MNAAQKKEVEKKRQLALDLFSAGCDMMLRNLRRKYPDVSEVEILKIHGQWLKTRPGAEFGDAVGSPGTRSFVMTDHE
jgi:hypothetical protein